MQNENRQRGKTLNQQQFMESCDSVINEAIVREGIGTLNEKTIHTVLKHYYEPDVSHHEIKVGRYYADIYNENGIIEIQTRQFNRLRLKLNEFLNEYRVFSLLRFA